MQERGFTEKDWKLFRSKMADWQEAYMDRLGKEYIAQQLEKIGILLILNYFNSK